MLTSQISSSNAAINSNVSDALRSAESQVRIERPSIIRRIGVAALRGIGHGTIIAVGASAGGMLGYLSGIRIIEAITFTTNMKLRAESPSSLNVTEWTGFFQAHMSESQWSANVSHYGNLGAVGAGAALGAVLADNCSDRIVALSQKLASNLAAGSSWFLRKIHAL